MPSTGRDESAFDDAHAVNSHQSCHARRVGANTRHQQPVSLGSHVRVAGQLGIGSSTLDGTNCRAKIA